MSTGEPVPTFEVLDGADARHDRPAVELVHQSLGSCHIAAKAAEDETGEDGDVDPSTDEHAWLEEDEQLQERDRGSSGDELGPARPAGDQEQRAEGEADEGKRAERPPDAGRVTDEPRLRREEREDDPVQKHEQREPPAHEMPGHGGASSHVNFRESRWPAFPRHRGKCGAWADELLVFEPAPKHARVVAGLVALDGHEVEHHVHRPLDNDLALYARHSGSPRCILVPLLVTGCSRGAAPSDIAHGAPRPCGPRP
jgi:hypothetical protein